MKAKTATSFLIFILLACFGYCQNSGDDLLGTWLSGDKKGHIEIFKKGEKYYGKIVWLREPKNEEGEALKDSNNPKEELQKRPLIGLVNLQDFEYDAADKEWEEGTIYDPENGNTYSCYITMENQNTINVRGFIGFSLIGRTDVWTRVEV